MVTSSHGYLFSLLPTDTTVGDTKMYRLGGELNSVVC